MLENLPVVSIKSCTCTGKDQRTSRDVGALVTVEKLRAWAEALPDDFACTRVGGQDRGEAGCLIEAYLRDVLDAKHVGAGYVCATVTMRDGTRHGVDWGHGPLGREVVAVYDAQPLRRVGKAALLEIIDSLAA